VKVQNDRWDCAALESVDLYSDYSLSQPYTGGALSWDMATMTGKFKVDAEMKPTFLFLVLKTTSQLQLVIPMNVSVSLEGDSTGPVTPPSTDTCYKAEIFTNKTMFEMYYDRGIEYSPLYAIVANATSTEVKKQFNVSDVS